MRRIEEILSGELQIELPDKELYHKIKADWDKVAKPLDSMGKFETVIARIGAIQRKEKPRTQKNALLVFCADNGVVEEGISQSDQSITAICAENIAKGLSSVGILAKEAKVDMVTVDVGVAKRESIPETRNRKVREGSRNFYKEPAMTTEEMLFAMQTGMDLVKECKDMGYDMVALGEMGIGNTTTSSAVCAALLSVPAKAVTGRGAGLCDEKLAHKIDVIQAAIEKYGLYEKEPLTVLETVGGYDIAAMAGACIGGACYGMPIVLDGFISMTAAYVACRINGAVKEYLIPSHASKEKAVTYLCKEMELSPVVDANMALGEGSGAMMMIALLKMAAAVLYESYSFENAKIEQYERFEGNT